MGERVGQIAKVPEVKKSSSNSRVRRSKRLQSMDTPADRILFLQRTVGNQAVSRLMRSGALQAKLRIGQPGDVYEQEADRVADAVMRMPEPGVQHQEEPEEEKEETLNAKPLVEEITPLVQRQVEPEEEEEALQTKEVSNQSPPVKPDLETNIYSLKTSGNPLPESTRDFFEPRFGYDFNQVRIHTGPDAVQMNRVLNAEAFTHGRDIYFGSEFNSPDTSTYRKILAHELVHVVQQGQGMHAGHIQRVCGSPNVGPTPPDCNLISLSPSGIRFRFNRGCDDFAPGEQAKLERFARSIPSTAAVYILGMASYDGNAPFNDSLSCHRADQGARVVHAQGRGGTIRLIRATGGVPGTSGDPAYRAVVIEVIGQPAPPIRHPLCGPDATDWFINQVNRSMTDPAALVIRGQIMAADRLARIYGITSHQVAEGGAASAVELQEARLGITGPPPPARRGAIVGQLAAGIASRNAVISALAAAITADPLNAARIISDFATIANLINTAANNWKILVDHGARWDFKAHFMNHPSSRNCPDEECPPGEVGIVTLCPQSNPQNCFESDLPGNFFYALIGKHVGWSELTLQLGSQFAELTDVRLRPARPAITWDTPQDTASISLGHRLPLPLTEAALCSAISSARGRLVRRSQCDNCLDTVSTVFI